MFIISVRFFHTNYIRKPVLGGLDSEPSHSAIAEREMWVLVSSDREDGIAQARLFVSLSYNHDPDFQILGASVVNSVDAIIHPPQYRL